MPMRVLAVPDVYAALTAERPYLPAYTRYRALELIDRDMPEHRPTETAVDLWSCPLLERARRRGTVAPSAGWPARTLASQLNPCKSGVEPAHDQTRLSEEGSDRRRTQCATSRGRERSDRRDGGAAPSHHARAPRGAESCAGPGSTRLNRTSEKASSKISSDISFVVKLGATWGERVALTAGRKEPSLRA
jgi:hypothetical protein